MKKVIFGIIICSFLMISCKPSTCSTSDTDSIVSDTDSVLNEDSLDNEVYVESDSTAMLDIDVND